MSLWQDYQKNRKTEVLVSEVTSSMRPAIFIWLHDVARHRLTDPYQVAVEIKNKFRIEVDIPRTRPNNYMTAPPEYRFAQFLLNIADVDSRLFFTILDYLVQVYLTRDGYPEKLEIILDEAGHRFGVQEVNGKKILAERLPDDQKKLLEHVLEGADVYASEFHDGFVQLYGTNPNYTNATGEVFQALESALKFYLGEDKGQNLGAILAWLKNNPKNWQYHGASKSQDDAGEQFIALIDFVNKSYRKTKHGQANEKLTIEKDHAEVIFRAVALLIFQLEKVIQILDVDEQDS